MESDTSGTTIQYQLSREDTIAQLWRLMLLPRLRVSLAVIFLCGLGLLALGTERTTLSFVLLVAPVGFLILYRRVVHRIVAQHPEFLETQTVSFDSGGISISNTVMSVQMPWKRVRNVTDTKDFYVFRFDTFGSGAIIPKRALTAEQSEQLLSFARSKGA